MTSYVYFDLFNCETTLLVIIFIKVVWQIDYNRILDNYLATINLNN